VQRRGGLPRIKLGVAPDGLRGREHLDLDPAASERFERARIWPHPPPSHRCSTAVMRNWKTGDLIPLEQSAVRVVGLRDDDADRPPVLVVEEV